MGSVLSNSGVQAGVSGVPPSSLSSVKTSRRPSKAGITSVRPRATPISRSDYGSTSRGARTRVLLKPLRCPEAKRRRQAYSGPKVIKPLFKSPFLSNGIHSLGGGRAPPGGFSGILGHQGGILVCPNLRKSPEVSVFCDRGGPLSVCVPPFWPGVSTKSFFTTDPSFAETARHCHRGLLRRPSSESSFWLRIRASQTLQEFGCVLNILKSVLVPTQHLEYLGLIRTPRWQRFFFPWRNCKLFSLQ